MEEVAKYCRKIFIAWIGAVVVTMLSWGIALHSNARQGRSVAKEVALQTLRGIAERVVNREFDGLKIDYSFWHANGRKSAKRKAISKAGNFEVVVDSLKEARGLYSLALVGGKASILNDYGKFPLKQMLAEWEGEMDARYSGVRCALSLKVCPLGNDGSQDLFVGDSASVSSCHELGTYYLDGMYTMSLTAYTAFGFGCRVDWTDALLGGLSVFFLFLVLAGGGFYVIRFLKHEKEENPNEVATACRFGECVFDSINHTLTYKDTTMPCTPQTAKLLLGFGKSPDFFLKNDEINAICGWGSDELGVNQRRRTAISTLKHLFAVDKSVKVDFIKEKKGYQIKISGNL